MSDNEITSIYSKEVIDRLFLHIFAISETMEEIIELIGTDAAAWRIKRADSETMVKVTALLQNLIDIYTGGYNEDDDEEW